jgi:hypothetical protein
MQAPAQPQRQSTSPIPRFKSIQDWFTHLNANHTIDSIALIHARGVVYKEIEVLRGRPLIVYFVKFAVPKGVGNSIDIGDIEGFTDLINSVPKEHDKVDILINSPGGSADITERIASMLFTRFKEVHYLVHHSAYSAATMLALSGNSITLHPSATLGPIDPQLDGVPARSITRGFENIKKKIIDEGPKSLPAYVPLIQKYSIPLLELCKDNLDLSEQLVTEWLKRRMLANKTDAEIQQVVKFFSEYDTHLTHSRPLMFEKIKDFGLDLTVADGQLADLLWECYIHLNGFMSISIFYKLFENRYGISWGRQNMQEMLTPKNPNPQPNQEIQL